MDEYDEKIQKFREFFTPEGAKRMYAVNYFAISSFEKTRLRLDIMEEHLI